ncbi:MAG TPA: methyltransferase domain-containing protein [Bacillota bacterium]|nr:methyltransferase domain-containing protein [Bacillota bacterium]HPT86313.1 methyltransferase domain-containing protein [Bacillota bacterium]
MDSTMGECEALIRQLKEVYSLKRISLSVEGHFFEIYKVEDIDPLLDQISDPEEIPFWAELWPASIGLVRFILGHADDFRETRCLELGAGVGLAGIAAKKAGALVLQSDYMRPALEFCRLNCNVNAVNASEFLLADWRSFPESVGVFDRIIGSDILYEKTLHSALAAIFRKHLKPGGKIILADPGRDYARKFVDECKSFDWRVSETLIPVEYESKSYQIRIYQLTKAGEP